jgi:phage shock protein A
MEAEAAPAGEIQEEYSGDVLASRFATLEKTAGAEDDLLALKRKMGMLPPEEAKKTEEAAPARVEAPPQVANAGPSKEEQDELAAALEEMEAEQQATQKKAAR